MKEKKFIKLTPFKMQILQSFPFIDADFDAITNYELLCKVVEYLNKTVENVDYLNDSVNDYIDKFNELKNYVDNYFDNLDVQEEINNKLDEMAESGELTDIIAQYLGLAGVLAFNTVADMKQATNLVNGSTAKTLGYNTINDGGGALYKIRNIASGHYEILNNDLYAILLTDEVNVKNFGAYGDNLHDDTDAIQNAINYANTNDYKIVKLPKGTYLTSKPILLYDRIKLIGEDRTNTIIQKYTNTTEPTYNIDAIIIIAKSINSEFNYARGQKIENLNIKSSNSSTYGIFSLTAAPYTSLKNLSISNVLTGIYYSHGAWLCEFENINISNCTTGISYKDTGTSTNFKNVYVQNSTNKAYDINGLSYSNLENLAADNCTGTVYHFSFCNLVINGLGSESTSATVIIELLNSGIVLNNPKLFTNNSNSEACVIKGAGSRLIINSGSIGGDSQEDALGKFVDISNDLYLEINKTKVRTNFLTRSYGSAQYNAFRLNDEKNSYSLIPHSQAPLTGLGDIMSDEYQESSIKNLNLLGNMGGIFFNVYGHPVYGATGERGYTRARKMGDIFVNQAPDKTGIAIFQQITEPKTFNLANPISSVTADGTNLILEFTNLNLDSDGELKKLAIHANDKVTSSSGGNATISNVNYSTNQITIKSITGTFAVDDTVTLSAKNNIRDTRFRYVQHLLSGTSDERILEPTVGMMYFDTTLGKPIWYKGSNKWVDSTGNNV